MENLTNMEVFERYLKWIDEAFGYYLTVESVEHKKDFNLTLIKCSEQDRYCRQTFTHCFIVKGGKIYNTDFDDMVNMYETDFKDDFDFISFKQFQDENYK